MNTSCVSVNTAADFRWAVDLVVALNDVNPALPELADLKSNAEQIVAAPGAAMHHLKRIDPDAGVTKMLGIIGVVQITCRTAEQALKPWSLARHHVDNLDERIAQIVVDTNGVWLYDGDGAPLVRYMDGAFRTDLADAEARAINACAFVLMFSGLNLNPHEHLGITQRLIVTKDTTGVWSDTIEPVRFAA